VIERWAKPVIPIGVEEAGRALMYGGRLWDIPCYILEDDDVERVRLGYVCIMCLEQHERNHPEHCSVCRFPIRAIQDQVFETLYEGEVRVGPTTTLADEWEMAKEAIERGGWASDGS
jgi:hypothetical protein